MRRVNLIRKQATVFHALSRSFHEMPTLQGDLLSVARRCEELAAEAERAIGQRLSKPIAK